MMKPETKIYNRIKRNIQKGKSTNQCSQMERDLFWNMLNARVAKAYRKEYGRDMMEDEESLAELLFA